MKQETAVTLIRRIIRKYIIDVRVIRVMIIPVLCSIVLGNYFDVYVAEISGKISASLENKGNDTVSQIFFFFIFSTLGAFFRCGGSYLLAKFVEVISREYIKDLYKETAQSKYLDYHATGLGETYSLILRKASAISTLMKLVARNFFSNCVFILLTIFKLYQNFGLRFLGIVMCVIGLHCLSVYILTKYRNKYRDKLNRMYDKNSRKMYDCLLNYDGIKAYNNEKLEIEGFNEGLQVFTYYAKVYWGLLYVASFIAESLLVTANVVFMFLFINENVASNALFANYVMLFTGLKSRLISVGNNVANITFYITNMLHTKLEVSVDDDMSKIKLSEFQNRLELKEVGLYLNEKEILHSCNVVIRKGEKLAIAGSNASGKSSFIKLMLGFYEYEGKLYIDGIDYDSLTKQSVRQLISYAPQDPFVFDDTLLGNLQNGDLTANEEQIIETCKNFKMHSMFSSLRDGYQTRIGERGKFLSGGQRQKLSFMRAAVKNAPIFLLDEVTSNFDKETEQQLIESIMAQLKDKTVIMVVHNLELLSKFDRILFFERGTIAAQGSLDTLLKTNNDFSVFYKKVAAY